MLQQNQKQAIESYLCVYDAFHIPRPREVFVLIYGSTEWEATKRKERVSERNCAYIASSINMKLEFQCRELVSHLALLEVDRLRRPGEDFPWTHLNFDILNRCELRISLALGLPPIEHDLSWVQRENRGVRELMEYDYAVEEALRNGLKHRIDADDTLYVAFA